MARRAVRVFLDSNVILSGLISNKGAPRVILDILSLGLPFLAAMTGRYNIIEIERNLAKKLPKALPVYKEYLPRINLEIVPLPKTLEVKNIYGSVADKDVPVIVSAVNGKADFLVTGDKKDFAKLKEKKTCPFKIVSPSEFVDVILPEVFKEIEGEGFRLAGN